MTMRCYLAMTAAEVAAAEQLPKAMGWMACHFSGYGTGLSNLPTTLPEGSMIIVNDRIPLHGHDPNQILEQLQRVYEDLKPACFLLDLQRPGEPLANEIVKLLAQKLPCPVGVTPEYAQDLNCPVFLPPPSLHISLQEHLAPWVGRPIWLEAASDSAQILVTENDCCIYPAAPGIPEEPVFEERKLHFLYHTQLQESAIHFHLFRGRDQLKDFLLEAETLGVTLAVGLYQQLRSDPLQ